MFRRRISLLAAVITLTSVAWRPSPAAAQVPTKSLPTPPVPSKSLPATGRVVRSFPARGIERVILRAEAAEKAKVKTVPGRDVILVTGIPAGDARGYHPADPNWRETPASQWGLDFAARRYDSTLVISSEKEFRYIHHYYHLEDIEIEVPPGVAVIRENRQLTGEQTPDLSPPDRKATSSPEV